MIRWTCVALGFTYLLLTPTMAHAQNPIERGKTVYAEQKCSICHSIGGVGNKKGPLDDVGSRLSTDDLRNWLVAAEEMTKKTKAERRPFMKSYSSLPKQDIDALVAYMATLKK